MTEPTNLDKIISKSLMEDIKNHLDMAEDGFFTLDIGKVKTANYFFDVKSPWARGKKEMVMISMILQEEDPDLDYYEKAFTIFSTAVKYNIVDSYQLFYFKSPPNGYLEQIKEKYDFLKMILVALNQDLQVNQVKIYGNIQNIEGIKKTKSIQLPELLMEDLTKVCLELNSEDFFVAIKQREKKVKLEMIPISAKKVIKLSFVFRETPPTTIIELITEIYKKNAMKLIFTSGICAHTLGRRKYELFLDSSDVLSQNFVEEYKSIPEIVEFKLITIK